MNRWTRLTAVSKYPVNMFSHLRYHELWQLFKWCNTQLISHILLSFLFSIQSLTFDPSVTHWQRMGSIASINVAVHWLFWVSLIRLLMAKSFQTNVKNKKIYDLPRLLVLTSSKSHYVYMKFVIIKRKTHNSNENGIVRKYIAKIEDSKLFSSLFLMFNSIFKDSNTKFCRSILRFCHPGMWLLDIPLLV